MTLRLYSSKFLSWRQQDENIYNLHRLDAIPEILQALFLTFSFISLFLQTTGWFGWTRQEKWKTVFFSNGYIFSIISFATISVTVNICHFPKWMSSLKFVSAVVLIGLYQRMWRSFTIDINNLSDVVSLMTSSMWRRFVHFKSLWRRFHNLSPCVTSFQEIIFF